MDNHIQWTTPAFRELERLTEALAFEIIRNADLLIHHPEIGPDLGSRFEQLAGYRQLIIKRNWRVIYKFDKPGSTVWILAVQNCRQRLPSTTALKRRKRKI